MTLDRSKIWTGDLNAKALEPQARVTVGLYDTTLAAVAQARPVNRAGLLALPGMGPVKVDRYGESMLAVLSSMTAVGVGGSAGAHRAS